MSPFVRYPLLALVTAALAFGVTHFALRSTSALATSASANADAFAASPDDELAWLQKEFHLTAAQTAAIAQLHADYEPICMEHCRSIIRTRKQLANATDPAAVRAELTRLEAVCQQATQAHLQRVAAVMAPSEAARFLALIGPKLSSQNHDAPLGLK